MKSPERQSKPSQNPAASAHPHSLLRTCSCGGSTTGADECTKCRDGRAEALSRSLNPPPSRHHFSAISVYPQPPQAPPRSSSSLFLTEEGTETIAGDSQFSATQTPGGPTASVCGVTGSFVNIPNGITLVATLVGNQLGARFAMIADFAPTTIPCSCSCGEYRQMVRGVFKTNGVAQTHQLCGTSLSPTTFQEDCGVFGGNTYRYGYRSNPFASSLFSSPDQATGCRFTGSDYPRLQGASGDSLEIDLDFQGSLVDTCTNATLATAEWSVGGTATIP